MISITNPKVACFVPQWAPYRGFSLLFDNPGASVSPLGRDWLKVDCSVGENDELRLYAGFAQFLKELGQHRLTNTYLFCPLPPDSYHVTVWDGLNDGNVHKASAIHRGKLEAFLAGLPDSLLIDEEFTGEVHRSPLVTRRNWSIKFRFSALAKRGNQSLVARLMPADGDSERELERILSDRAALSTRFREQFGIEVQGRYSPHVTLGYFANEEYAELSTPHITRWNESVKNKVDRLTITFSSVSLYGFTDMSTFFKGSNRKATG